MLHITKENVELVIRERGWIYSPWYQHGGWIHHEVRDNDGCLRIYDSAEEVCRLFDIAVSWED